MKNLILFALGVASLGMISCSNSNSGTASSGDFSSLTPNATYDNESFSSYSRVKLDGSLAFTQYEVRDVNGVQKECSVQGTYSLVSGEDSPDTGNAIKVSGATVNGVAVSDIVYPVSQLDSDTLKIQLGDDAPVDLTNQELTNYSTYQGLNPSSLPTDDFCKP